MPVTLIRIQLVVSDGRRLKDFSCPIYVEDETQALRHIASIQMLSPTGSFDYRILDKDIVMERSIYGRIC